MCHQELDTQPTDNKTELHLCQQRERKEEKQILVIQTQLIKSAPVLSLSRFFVFFFFSQMETEVCLPLENVPFQALKVIRKFRRFTSWTHDSPPSPLESKTYFGICLFEICLLNLQQFHKLTTCGTVFLGANIY